jgi:hypothetical protein
MKIGYLNLKTGKYKFIPVIEHEGDKLTLLETKRQNNYGKSYSIFENRFSESLERLKSFTITPNMYGGNLPLIVIKH